MREIIDDLDLHTDNQTVFGLPSRLIAKIFLYRMIFANAFGDRGFRGPAYAYAKDPDFMPTSTSPKFWESVVEKFFGKYEGVYEHSLACIRTAIETGRLEVPSGRFYEFTQVKNSYTGRFEWPLTTILNYPVQGFSADVMKMVRLLLRSRLNAANYQGNVLLINTVHDDIELDVDNNPELVYNISILLESCFKDVDKVFAKNYGFDLNVPMAGEVKYGFSLHESAMVKFKPKTFEEDFTKICKSR